MEAAMVFVIVGGCIFSKEAMAAFDNGNGKGGQGQGRTRTGG